MPTAEELAMAEEDDISSSENEEEDEDEEKGTSMSLPAKDGNEDIGSLQNSKQQHKLY